MNLDFGPRRRMLDTLKLVYRVGENGAIKADITLL